MAKRLIANAEDVLDYWYSEGVRAKWFSATTELDDDIRLRFEDTWFVAVDGQLMHWMQSASGALALVIVLDQFPLNMYRGQAKSFSSEAQAIAVTKKAIQKRFDQLLPQNRKSFLIMPLMHSESLDDQDLCVETFIKHKLESNIRFAEHHRELIRRFGRFPHRNSILGRESTKQELAYLASKEAFLG